MRIDERADLRALARDVVVGAVKDLLFGTAIEQVAALEFVTSKDFQFWKDIGNMDISINTVFENPQRIRKLITLKKTRKL